MQRHRDGEQGEPRDPRREPDRVDPRPGRGQQRAEEVNVERSGDGHPQPGGGQPDHVSEGVVSVLQEDADPREGLRGGDGSARECAGDGDGQNDGHGRHGDEGQHEGGGYLCVLCMSRSFLEMSSVHEGDASW